MKAGAPMAQLGAVVLSCWASSNRAHKSNMASFLSLLFPIYFARMYVQVCAIMCASNIPSLGQENVCVLVCSCHSWQSLFFSWTCLENLVSTCFIGELMFIALSYLVLTLLVSPCKFTSILVI